MQAATELASWESKYSHLVPIYILKIISFKLKDR